MMNPTDLEQVSEILHAARGLPPNERSAYLDLKCSGDIKIREEVERLLTSDNNEFSQSLDSDNGAVPASHRLSPGQIFGNYRILEIIGVGGMGEVYLAEDSRLKRKVALKILPQRIASNPDRLRRFEREAVAASALNHPNILTIYEFVEYDDTFVLASEFIDGQSLRERMAKRKFSLRESIDIALQTGAALDTAHRHGIVHRDIKPENIMLRNDDLVKVLDFGLAKYLYTPPDINDSDSDVPTREKFSTESGIVMGTVTYMSPEQARGKSIDARTDIWSLGVVLYEMITGRLPFQGETNSDKVASILRSDPEPISIYAQDAPHELEHIIRKALGKDRDDRYQSIKDMTLDLKIAARELVQSAFDNGVSTNSGAGIKNVPTEVLKPYETEGFYRRRLWLRLAAALFILISAAGGYMWFNGGRLWSKPPAEQALKQLTSWKVEIGDQTVTRPRFSPNGQFIAYAAVNNGRRSIWLQQNDGGSPFTLRESESADAFDPIWSPDGAQIAFVSTRGGVHGIWASRAFGGPVSLVLASGDHIDSLVRWARTGASVYFGKKENLYSVDINSKEIAKLTNFDENVYIDREFDVSPDENRIAYLDAPNGQVDIWVSGIHGENPVQITNDKAQDYRPIWHPNNGRLIFSSERNGIVQVFSSMLTGPPSQIVFGNSDSYVSDVSSDGLKVLSVDTRDDADLWHVDVDDRQNVQLTSDLGAEYWQDISPDGETLIYQTSGKMDGAAVTKSTLWARRIDKAERPTQLASDGFEPRVSPDGRLVAYLRLDADESGLWLTSIGGGDARALAKQVVQVAGFSVSPFSRVQSQDYQWTPDGNAVVYCSKRNGVSNVWQAGINEGGETQLTRNEDSRQLFFSPLVSQDGTRTVWLSSSRDIPKRNWTVWTLLNGSVKKLFETSRSIALIGWSASGTELVVRLTDASERDLRKPSTVEIALLDVNTGSLTTIDRFENVYAQTVIVARDGSLIGFAGRSGDHDVIQEVSLNSRTTSTVVEANETGIYLSNPIFTPDHKSIVYGKQARWQIISEIENLRP